MSQRSDHKGVDRTPANLPGPIDIEGADREGWEPILLVVIVGEVFGREVADSVGPAGCTDGAQRRDITLAYLVGVGTENLARREVNKSLDLRFFERGFDSV